MKKLLAFILTLSLALCMLPTAALAAGDGWRAEDGGWRYYENGAPCTGVCWLEAEQGRYIFDETGLLQTGDAEGDVPANGNLYYINPEKDTADPASCYAVHDYARAGAMGVTYYNRDGITFAGWIDAGDGKRMYQTLLSAGSMEGVDKDTYIYVWRAAALPEGTDPVTGAVIPAGTYLFDDFGVLVQEAGEHLCGDGNTYYTDATGRVTEPAHEDSGAQDQSGYTSLAKLSKDDIRALLAQNPGTQPDAPFEIVPVCTAPYTMGKLTQPLLEAAVNRLSMQRRLAGLPGVTVDEGLNEAAQRGAVILAKLGTVTHTPGRPDDMTDEEYAAAANAAANSNLTGGLTLMGALDRYMDDSDASNVPHLGHRRWQLNPAMAKVGFGYAQADTRYRQYTAEMCMDMSGYVGVYDFIGWPASGNFPANTDMFTANTAWSVTLNPKRYQKPDPQTVTVTITRASDGQTWTLAGGGYQPAASGAYFNVENSGYGVSNCIIFRPDGIAKYEGIYTVRIDGLTTIKGEPASLSYWVDFFDA